MILVHLDTNDSILLLSNDKSFHALYYIIKQMDLNLNIWYSDTINKKEISSTIGVSLPTLEKMISSLKQKNLIQSISRGKYRLTELLIDY